MTNKPPITTQCSLFIPNIYNRWSLIHLYILAPLLPFSRPYNQRHVAPFYLVDASCVLFYNYTISSLQFHHSLPKQEQSLEFNRAGRKDVAKFCTCAGGEYLQCICVCVCLKNFHGIIFSFISKGYPTKIMILYLNLWVIKNIIFVKFNQTCWNIRDFKTKFEQKINFVIGLKQNINNMKKYVYLIIALSPIIWI